MIKCGECSGFPIFKCSVCEKLLCTSHASKHKKKSNQSHQILDYLNTDILYECLNKRLLKIEEIRNSIESLTRSYYLNLFDKFNTVNKLLDSFEKKYRKLFSAKDMNKIEIQQSIEILQSDLKIFSSQSKNPLKFLSSIKIEEIPLKHYKKEANWLELRKFSDLNLRHQSKVLFIGFSPNSKYFVSSSDDKILKFWNLKKMKLINQVQSSIQVNSFAFIEDQNKILAVGQEGLIEKYNFKTGIKEKTIKGHDLNILAIDIDSNSKSFITASLDSTVKLWDFNTFSQQFCFKGHQDTVFCVKFTFDDQFIVSGSFDKSIIVWDYKNRVIKGNLVGHSGSIYSLEVSLNPKIIFSGAADGQIIAWDINRMEKKFVLAEHSNIIYSLKISKNNKFLVSGSADEKLIIWDLELNKKDRVVSNNSAVICVAVDNSGKILMFGMENGKISHENLRKV